MIKPALLKFALAIILLFACSTIPAFAQRGGGSRSGGFHGGGGGGFHGGGSGGFRSGGGGFAGGLRGGSSSPPRASTGFSRSIPSAPLRSGGGSVERPGGNVNRSYSAPVNGNQRVGNSVSPSRGIADGQWHSFGNASAGRGAVASAPEAGASGNTGGGSHVFGGSRTAGSGVTRSFSGQGNEIWENASVARNVVPSSRALSSIRGSFANSSAGNSGLRSGASLSATSRFAAGSAFGNRISSKVPGSIGVAASRGVPRFGNTFNRFGRGFRGGCWNCGFRFGIGFGLWPGWGFGWPWLGYWNWDPFYWDSLSWGWSGYGYYGYPAANSPGYYPYDDGYSYSAPSDESYPSADLSAQSAGPAAQSSPQTFSVANGAAPVLLYLKDGSVYSARSYWVAGGKLHFVLLSGAESAVDMEQFDMQRTIDVNAKSGVPFTLKPDPDSSAPAPGEAPPAGSPNRMSQINLTLAPTAQS